MDIFICALNVGLRDRYFCALRAWMVQSWGRLIWKGGDQEEAVVHPMIPRCNRLTRKLRGNGPSTEMPRGPYHWVPAFRGEYGASCRPRYRDPQLWSGREPRPGRKGS